MILGASELIVLNGNPIDNAKLLKSIAGSVEMMLDGDAWSNENGTWQKTARVLKELKYEYTIHPPAWDCNIAAGMYSLRRAAQDLNISALDVCTCVGARQIVFHTGYCDKNALFDKKLAQRHSMEALEEMISLAKPLGITVAVENIAPPSLALYTQDEYAHILDGVDETAQYLIDLGHANMNGWNIPKLIGQVSSRLCALHIHDNNGIIDQHLPIGHGTIPWEETFCEMEKLKLNCHFILEYAPGTDINYLCEGIDLLKARFKEF